LATPAPAVVRGNNVCLDLEVESNRPGGANVTNNTAGRNALCSGNSPQTGNGNRAGSVRTCPA
jgi:hypothetical protein